MIVSLQEIPLREALHFLGWHGTPIEPELMASIRRTIGEVKLGLEPRVACRRFRIKEDGSIEGARFRPEGGDVRKLLSGCGEIVLLAATLGAQSERMLLRSRVRDAAEQLILDAVLSAAIEAVCDQQEDALRRQLERDGLYLKDRFSPGYGDMPIGQSADICAALEAEKTIGLTIAASGTMIPRKSVTAVMGVSRSPAPRRRGGCAVCSAKESCPMRRTEE